MLSLLILDAAAFLGTAAPRFTHPPSHRAANVRLAASAPSEELRSWLMAEAGVAPQFVDRVIETCDREMIGNLNGLRIARDAGLLPGFFPAVVALGIEEGLGRITAPRLAVAAAQVSAVVQELADEADAAALAPGASLECDPYHAIAANLPLNTYKNKAPLAGAIISAKRIVGPAAPGEVCHIRIGTGDKFRYWEGQSLGVIPPGVNAKTGKPNAVRLYSIASTRYGDDAKGSSVSLCVRRALYWDADTGAHDPAKKGVCSNFLCDSSPGDEVHLTGPTGKVMLMPEHEPATDLIMLATGTGIAPYRGFLRRLFLEPTPAADAFRGPRAPRSGGAVAVLEASPHPFPAVGLAWLFLGVANRDALLYDDEWQAILQRETARGRSAAQGRESFRLTYALSREESAPGGGKMYIQDKVAQHADEVFERMDNGAHMYFCGLKGMMPGITEMLEGVCKEKGLVWEDKLSEWKKAGQWHVEVY